MAKIKVFKTFKYRVSVSWLPLSILKMKYNNNNNDNNIIPKNACKFSVGSCFHTSSLPSTEGWLQAIFATEVHCKYMELYVCTLSFKSD